MVWSNRATWSHSNRIIDDNINPIDISFTLRIIDLNNHLNKLSWHVSIFFKKNICTWKSFVYTTTTHNLTWRWFFLTFYHSTLSKSYLTRKFHLKFRWHWLYSYGHLINNDSFFSWSYMTKRCWPPLKSFKTKWKTILTWLKTITLINHSFIFSEHISCFIISHLIILISWVSNIFRPMIKFSIIFRLWIWYNYRSVRMKNLIFRNFCNWIDWLRSSRVVMSGRSIKPCSLYPFDTLISCKLHRYSCRSCYKTTNINKNISVDCLTWKIKIFISLDIEISH